MITGYATQNGTKMYAKKFSHTFKNTPWFSTSPIALGTHLGEMTEADSNLYEQAIEYGLKHGINFIDTAINYRGMRSERDVGKVFWNLIHDEKVLTRDQVVISTKAGIIPGDIEANLVPKAYLQEVLLKRRIITEADIQIVDHHRHTMTPSFFEFAIHESRNHLRLTTIDIYYLHNPEISIMVLGEKLFFKQLETLFDYFEQQVEKGNIRFYGLATWHGFIYHPEETGYIPLEKVIQTAKNVAGNNHHFKFIQLPLNRKMPDGVKKQNQFVKGKWLSVVEAAEELGLFVTTSAPFHLGNLLNVKMTPRDTLTDLFKEKGIFATMVGMKNMDHVRENLDICRCFFQRNGNE